ncbi:tRNA (guanine(37)-N1)-methyltransferase-like [Octopus vulgaris]|uniref:tRNA (guanine(37)-N1)-methyltransferase n=1 Tax=Octopus vulgaris TaxID=6645 RepID=A0AA36AYU1_OCTVU|nr:tRNA (guanine(37)-N1)-methyltransferase-like [Octopus vulgaris]
MNTWHKKLRNVLCSLKKFSGFTTRQVPRPRLSLSHRNIYKVDTPINNRTTPPIWILCISFVRKLIGGVDGANISSPSKKSILPLSLRNRYYYPVMSSDVFPCEEIEESLLPPESVRGMTQLDRSAFKQTILVPALKVPRKHISLLSKRLKKSLAHFKKIKSIAELSESDPHHDDFRLFLFDPSKYRDADCFSEEERQLLLEAGVDVETALFWAEIGLSYDNWNASEILRAILPKGFDNVSGFSNVGHIAHFNLREETLPYKFLIGQVILDKVPSVRTVVNKTNIIDNTFRNFQMELLAGEDDFYATVRENKCIYQFDFSKVYWNSRLSMEHERIVSKLEKGDVVYDVFAGVGPFAIPAAKKGCVVLANDLNPESYKSLVHNAAMNRIKSDFCAYNLDGRKFIRNSVKEDMCCRWLQLIDAEAIHSGVDCSNVSYTDNNNEKAVGDNIGGCNSGGGIIGAVVGGICTDIGNAAFTKNWTSPAFHIVMNLPAIAVEFLDVFQSMCSDIPVTSPVVSLLEQRTYLLPHVYCYCFYKGDNPEADIEKRVRQALRCDHPPQDLVIRFVRNVAPSKDMYCVEFVASKELLWRPVTQTRMKVDSHGNSKCYADSQPEAKKRRMETLEVGSQQLLQQHPFHCSQPK